MHKPLAFIIKNGANTRVTRTQSRAVWLRRAFNLIKHSPCR